MHVHWSLLGHGCNPHTVPLQRAKPPTIVLRAPSHWSSFPFVCRLKNLTSLRGLEIWWLCRPEDVTQCCITLVTYRFAAFTRHPATWECQRCALPGHEAQTLRNWWSATPVQVHKPLTSCSKVRLIVRVTKSHHNYSVTAFSSPSTCTDSHKTRIVDSSRLWWARNIRMGPNVVTVTRATFLLPDRLQKRLIFHSEFAQSRHF